MGNSSVSAARGVALQRFFEQIGQSRARQRDPRFRYLHGIGGVSPREVVRAESRAYRSDIHAALGERKALGSPIALLVIRKQRRIGRGQSLADLHGSLEVGGTAHADSIVPKGVKFPGGALHEYQIATEISMRFGLRYPRRAVQRPMHVADQMQ